MAPFFSVVIPTYKRQERMQRAVLSAVSQECDRPFEIIVVDDNPPGSGLRERNGEWLSQKAPSVRHVINTGKSGGSGARNFGIEAATGEWIAFLDDDDEWLAGKLQAQAMAASDADDAIACIDTGFHQKNEITGESRTHLPRLQGEIFEDLLVKHRGRAPKLSTLICRRSALIEVGMFDTSLPARQDLDLYLRLARKYRFQSIGQPLAIKHIHAGERISSDPRKKADGFAGFYEKYRKDFELRPNLHRIFLRKYARWCWRSGRIIGAIRLYLRSISRLSG